MEEFSMVDVSYVILWDWMKFKVCCRGVLLEDEVEPQQQQHQREDTRDSKGRGKGRGKEGISIRIFGKEGIGASCSRHRWKLPVRRI